MSEVQTPEANTITPIATNEKSNRLPDKLIQLDPKKIKPSRTGNPRDSIVESDYNNLKSSIKAYGGIHTPVAVWIVEGEYEMIYGNTRTKICIELGIESIPVLIKDIENSDQAHELSLSENIDRNKMTLLQEARGLKKIVLRCGGDLLASASVMGWSESKFKKALQLLKATPKVQALIGVKQLNNFTLTEGHASQLSLVPPKIQNRLVDAIIHEKMTINHLSTQLKKSVSLPLASATFCKKECDSCQYNSSQQTALLPSLGFDDESCGNPICFKTKTDEHFQNKMEEMQKEHGKIVLKSTVEVAMEVNADLVGDEQLAQCKRCDMHCAILNDKTELGQGQIIENQCIDPSCLQDKMKLLMVAKKEERANKAEKFQGSTTADAGKKPAKQTEQTESKPTPIVNQKVTIPNRCKFGAQKEIRSIASVALNAHDNYALALTVASLQYTLGKGCITTNIDKLIKKEASELNQLREKILIELTTQHQNFSCNMEKAVIKCANENTPDFNAMAIQAWKPTATNLGDMTKQIRTIVLEDSGFVVAYEKEKSEKEYTALLAKKSNDQVKEILAFNFDWSHFAPSYYIESLDKPSYHNGQ